jgi:hypothetical protein
METAEKWDSHEIVVKEHMVAFVEVPPISSSFFIMAYLRPFFFYVVLFFLRNDPSVCEKSQAVVGYRVAQHPKFGSPTAMVFVA